MTVSPPADPSPVGPTAGVVSTQRLGGCVIVRLHGVFEAADLAALETGLTALAAADHVVVELSRAQVPAPPALRALTAAHAEAGRHGTSIHVTGADGALRRFLHGRTGGHADGGRPDGGPAFHESLADAVEAALTARDARPESRRRS